MISRVFFRNKDLFCKFFVSHLNISLFLSQITSFFYHTCFANAAYTKYHIHYHKLYKLSIAEHNGFLCPNNQFEASPLLSEEWSNKPQTLGVKFCLMLGRYTRVKLSKDWGSNQPCVWPCRERVHNKYTSCLGDTMRKIRYFQSRFRFR